MSRIGRQPVEIPGGVEVRLEGNRLAVKGPRGELVRDLHPAMRVRVEEGAVRVERPDDTGPSRSLHGLTRTLIANMVEGVSKGFEKALELQGVGYRAAKSGSRLVLTVGYSHPVEMTPPEGVTVEVPAPGTILVRGANKEAVGEFAAKVRSVRPPEPYKGKGIRYRGEQVRRKVGKTGKK
ncbi:MAG: 50S ribosomal protein L6 [Firmicutes bacterium]|nr:50S ribosomal protein L6 [Bacillota bacterium]